MLYNDRGQEQDKVNDGNRSLAFKAGFPAFITFHYALIPSDKVFNITPSGAFPFIYITRKAVLTGSAYPFPIRKTIGCH